MDEFVRNALQALKGPSMEPVLIELALDDLKVLLPVRIDDAEDADPYPVQVNNGRAFWLTQGFTLPIRAAAAPPPPPAQAPRPPQQQNGFRQGPPPPPQRQGPPQQQFNNNGWGKPQCRYHGDTMMQKSGNFGSFWECATKAYDSQPSDWPFRDGAKKGEAPLGYTYYSEKEGRYVFCCAEKSR